MTKKTNVLILLPDSLRPDYLGCYGDKNIRSRNIDLLANQGTLFKVAYAENQTPILDRTYCEVNHGTRNRIDGWNSLPTGFSSLSWGRDIYRCPYQDMGTSAHTETAKVF